MAVDMISEMMTVLYKMHVEVLFIRTMAVTQICLVSLNVGISIGDFDKKDYLEKKAIRKWIKPIILK